MGSRQFGRGTKQPIARWKYVLPNLITGLRLAIVVVLFFFFIQLAGKVELTKSQLAAIILLVAAITDVLDGPLARKYNTATRGGDYFDHIADLFMLVYIFWAGNQIFWVWLYWPFVVLQSMVIGTAAYHVKCKPRAEFPNWQGKIAIIGLVTAFCLRMVTIETRLERFTVHPTSILLAFAVVLRAWSLIEYWWSHRTTEDKQKPA